MIRDHDLRSFQRKALMAVAAGPDREQFLFHVVPGGGKTLMSILCAQQMKANRIIFLSPRRAINRQTRDAFFSEQVTLIDDVPMYAQGHQGIVRCYSWVPNHVEALREYAWQRDNPSGLSVFIIDEAHRLAEDNKERAKEATALEEVLKPPPADLSYRYGRVRKLVMTGTPFRADGRRLRFVEYDESTGLPIADVTYSLKHGISEKVLRPVVFHRQGGFGDYMKDGQEQTYIVQDAAKSDTSGMWSLLRADGQWMRQTIGEARATLDALRREQPDAACLIVCQGKSERDKGPANRVYRLLQDMGESAVLVTSEEARAQDKIAKFRQGRQRFLVAIQMVSEGVDIPRLRCLIHATSHGVGSETYCRQLWARAMRRPQDAPLGDSHVWIPDHASFREYAERIEEEQRQAVRAPSEPRDPKGPLTPSDYVWIESQGQANGLLYRGQAYDERAALVQANLSHLQLSIPDAQQCIDVVERIAMPKALGQPRAETHPQIESQNLRRQCQDLAVQLAQAQMQFIGAHESRLGEYIARARSEVNRRVGFDYEKHKESVPMLRKLKAGLMRDLENWTRR